GLSPLTYLHFPHSTRHRSSYHYRDVLLTSRLVSGYLPVQNHGLKHKHGWCRGNHNDAHHERYIRILAGHSDMHVLACFDGMRYQILLFAVSLGTSVWWLQYQSDVPDCVRAQAALLHESFQ